MENFKSIPGGICAPAGFSAAGVHCGIRHNHSKLDLALIKADVRCAGAGCYTTNKVYGSPRSWASAPTTCCPPPPASSARP